MEKQNSQKIIIGYISDVPITHKAAWSGTVYKLYESISKNFNVVYIPTKISQWCKLKLKFFKIICKLLGKHTSHLNFVAKSLAKNVDNKLLNDVNILFVRDSHIIAYLETDKPIIYLADSTFASIYNYYPSFSNYFKFNYRQGMNIEKRALEKCTYFISSSDWAKTSAIKDYGISESKIQVLEFGANIDNKDIIVNTHQYQREDILNILFSGVDWERKGGDIAVQCCEYLNNIGIKNILHIVGINNLPMKYTGKDFIKNYGYFNKNNTDEYRRYTEILKNADILLLPTKAECAGIVFSEASAMNIPIFTYNTGGIGNYVIDGINGYKMGINCNGIDFANKIKDVIDNGEFIMLKLGAEKMYKEKLNWNVWTEKFKKIVYNIIES